MGAIVSIIVSCSCGKKYSVRDDFAGRQFNCKSCNSTILTPSALSVEETTVPVALSVENPKEIYVQKATVPEPILTKACPWCAETIHKEATVCRYCKQVLNKGLSDSDLSARRLAVHQSLDELFTDPIQMAKNKSLRGSLISLRTYVLFCFIGLGIIMSVLGFAKSGEEMVFVAAFGVIFIFFFGIASIVSFFNDVFCSSINTKNPLKTFKRYFLAVRTRRFAKAYAALAPSARTVGSVKTVEPEKIPFRNGSYKISSLESFKEYSNSYLKGPPGHTRYVNLLKVRLVKQDQGTAVVEAEIKFSSYPTLLLILIIVPLICVILIVALTKSETLTVRKLLVEHNGKWFVADGEFDGPLDQTNLPEA
jgi:hypothetical protein